MKRRQTSTKLHGATSQKTVVFIFHAYFILLMTTANSSTSLDTALKFDNVPKSKS
jgi:hypothetical protein